MSNTVESKLTDLQLLVIRSALADLIGAWQDWNMKGKPDSYHDWDAHVESIWELAREFHLTSEVPEELQ